MEVFKDTKQDLLNTILGEYAHFGFALEDRGQVYRLHHNDNLIAVFPKTIMSASDILKSCCVHLRGMIRKALKEGKIQ